MKKKVAVKEKSAEKKEKAIEKEAVPQEKPLLQATVSDETLEGTPARVISLLRGVATIREVRAQLRQCGYSKEEHQRGWSLLQAASGFSEHDTDWEDKSVAEAIAAIDGADERLFAIAGAVLKHSYPKQHAFLFSDLHASKGFQSVTGMKRFLDRVAQLEAGTATKDAKQDRAAFAVLSARVVVPERRKELAGWVTTAMSLTDDEEGATAKKAQEQQEKDRRQALIALRMWFEEWSQITRAVVSRKDFLIRLGLAQPKRRVEPGANDAREEPVDGA